MHKNYPPRIRDRFAREVFPVRSAYAGAVWAIRKWYHDDQRIAEMADQLLKDIDVTFGWTTRLITPLLGKYVYHRLKKEEERLASGWTYEPHCFYEKNTAARLLGKDEMAKSGTKEGKLQPVLSEPRPA